MNCYLAIQAASSDQGVELCTGVRKRCSVRLACSVFGIKESSYYKWRLQERHIANVNLDQGGGAGGEMPLKPGAPEAEMSETWTRKLDRLKSKALSQQLFDIKVLELFKTDKQKRGYRTIAGELHAAALDDYMADPNPSATKPERPTEKAVRLSMRRQGLSAKQERSYKPQTTERCDEADRKQNLLLHNAPMLQKLPFDIDYSELPADQLAAIDTANNEPLRLRASQPWQVLVSDITYIRMRESHNGWGYLCCWQDQFTRRIAGWAVGYLQIAELVDQALQLALSADSWRGYPLICHSDGGGQYLSDLVKSRLKAHQSIQSITRRGNTLDNAQAESLWSRLKVELNIVRKSSEADWIIDLAEAKRIFADYIEYYNTQRPHSSLGYTYPLIYEQRWRRQNVPSRRPCLVAVPASLRSAGTATKQDATTLDLREG